jgi:hypothetical protein
MVLVAASLLLGGCFERVYFEEEADTSSSEPRDPPAIAEQPPAEPIVTEPVAPPVEETSPQLPASDDDDQEFAKELEESFPEDEPSDLEPSADEALSDDLFGSSPIEEVAEDEDESETMEFEPPAEESPPEQVASEEEPEEEAEPMPSIDDIFGETAKERAESQVAEPPDLPLVAETTPLEAAPRTSRSTRSTPVERTPQNLNTRLDAWLLGSKLSLAILARQRGAPEETTSRWLAEAEQLALRLGVSRNFLKDAMTMPTEKNNSRIELGFLLDVGKDVGAHIDSLHGAEHAALFETALKSNLFLVLYGPDEPLVADITQAVGQSAKRANLPPRLWEPALTELSEQTDFNEVKRILYGFHQDIGRYLAE